MIKCSAFAFHVFLVVLAKQTLHRILHLAFLPEEPKDLHNHACVQRAKQGSFTASQFQLWNFKLLLEHAD